MALLCMQTQAQEKTFQTSVSAGAYYFYSPKNVDYTSSLSVTAGYNFNKKTFIGIGMDISKPYYDQYFYHGFYVEGKKMINQGNVSPFIMMRYGFGLENGINLSGNYLSPGIGIIQHLEKNDIQFTFGYKYHNHNDLIWVQGFEMRLSLIFN